MFRLPFQGLPYQVIPFGFLWVPEVLFPFFYPLSSWFFNLIGRICLSKLLKLPFLWLLQVRTFRGHTNEKNFVGLTVNSEYVACGSETNEVFVYQKVRILLNNQFNTCQTKIWLMFWDYFRKSQNLWLGIDLVHQVWMKQMMIHHLSSSVLYAGRMIAPLCLLLIVREQ